jgi:uncharacterized protein with ATP-grasp and redox domains
MCAENEELTEKVLREVLSYLLHEKWDKNTAEIGTNIHRIVKQVTNNMDPYKPLKTKYNQLALDLCPKFKHIVEISDNPLLTAAKIATLGNAIDFGPKTEIDIEKETKNLLDRSLAINDIGQLKKSALKIKNILYLADNAGETFFDRILIDELVKRKINVTYVVKAAPILNDATLQDAELSGITNMAKVITTGTDCIGIFFKECSKEFLKEFERSRLVISKGQGNYESLSDNKNKEIYFLLKVKCPIISENIDSRVGSLVLKKSFDRK